MKSALFGLCLLSLALGCEDKKAGAAAGVPTAAALPTQPRELLVLAASSLKAAFTMLEPEFEWRHPEVDVRFSFAGTQELRRQLEAGAAADVFASADEKHLQALQDQKLVEAPVLFAENEPVIVTFATARHPVKDLVDLKLVDRLVLGVPEVPIGRYSLEILDRAEKKLGAGFRAAVEARVVSRELNVRQVLAKITLGEADAGIVYRSDVSPPHRSVRVVPIPEEVNVIARYPIAVVARAPQAELARAWVALVTSKTGRVALDAAGFRVLPD